MAEAKTQVTVGARYVHYKGADKIYKVTGIAVTEADDTLCVIYQAQYGARLTFTRPLTSWLETVELEGETVPRFTKH